MSDEIKKMKAIEDKLLTAMKEAKSLKHNQSLFEDPEVARLMKKRDSLSTPYYDFGIDTALSWDGRFPPTGLGDYLVTILIPDGPHGTQKTVLVSRRYTKPTREEAKEIALDAVKEKYRLTNARIFSIKRINKHGGI